MYTKLKNKSRLGPNVNKNNKNYDKNKILKFYKTNNYYYWLLLEFEYCQFGIYMSNIFRYAINRTQATFVPSHAYVCVCVCVCARARVLTQCAESGHCACSTHAKCGLSAKSAHTWGLLLVLTSDLNSSPLKTQELTIKLWSSQSLLLALKLFLESFYIWIKVRSWLKSHIS